MLRQEVPADILAANFEDLDAAVSAVNLSEVVAKLLESGMPLEEAEEALGRALMRGLLWIILPACASALLLATTNTICLDIAVVPFLWVLPLSLYLLTFIISFDSPRWYWRPLWLLLLALAGCCLTARCLRSITLSRCAAEGLELGARCVLLCSGSNSRNSSTKIWLPDRRVRKPWICS